MPAPVRLSILDLAPVADGTTTPAALAETIRLAKLGEDLGFARVWYAEHHGMPSIAASSPDVLIASSAAHTARIHVGSGGVMLPNHVPLRVAETYRTLNALYPGRIDLGIGRAGGSDGRTLSALRSFGGEYFTEQMTELLAFEHDLFAEGHPFHGVRVVPEQVTLPPIWLLGSSGASAAAAGKMGAGYAFAAHFSATPPGPAFAEYRNAFQPSAQFEKPHAILCLSVLCAPTDAEAEFIAGSQALSWALFHSGEERRLVSPEAAAAHAYTAHQRAIIAKQGELWTVGSPETVKAEIMAKLDVTGADEVMITTTAWSYDRRLDSYRLLAEAFGLEGGAARPAAATAG